MSGSGRVRPRIPPRARTTRRRHPRRALPARRPLTPPPELAQAAILAEARRIAELGDDIDEDALDAELARMTAEAPEEGEAYPDDDDDPAGRAGASAPTLRPEDVDLPRVSPPGSPNTAPATSAARSPSRRASADPPTPPTPPTPTDTSAWAARDQNTPRSRSVASPSRPPRDPRRAPSITNHPPSSPRERDVANESARRRVGRRAGDSRERRHHRRGEGAGARRFGSRTRDGSSQGRGPRGTTRTERTRTRIRRGSNR